MFLDGSIEGKEHGDGVAIGLGGDEFLPRHKAAATVLVDDYDRFSQRLFHFDADPAGDDVGATAGAKSDQHRNRPFRVRCLCDVRLIGKRGDGETGCAD
ncbi:hypothetical protein RA307_14990 [Xanthobacteraceae bacterium Astr-EGSB]|uniref:hypothetical protein n=1 Tax=Astrobacterium formosum TaxID=3069710 RepID=UPI0027AE7FD8|nr:hypothetical protein [Xanthobacteraceae bacterium Astr-EGSB]